jgi:hypothetical protein
MNNYQNNESLSLAKARLKQAEEDYAYALEQHIKINLFPKCSMSDSHYEKFLNEKKFLVGDYVMDMEVWSIQEEFLKDHHYLEKLVQLVSEKFSHYSNYIGDEKIEATILDGIRSSQ